MADLDDLTSFALERGLDLTNPLTHEQVEALAEAWVPEIRFHEDERFHPVDVAATFTVPPPIFNAISFTLRTRSVMSSRTPGSEENSCRMPSIWIAVTAAP